MNQLLARRDILRKRLNELDERLLETKQLLANRACVYVTGSFGRREASKYSDLDLFIVKSELTATDGGSERFTTSELSRLDAICVRAELIKGSRDLGFPPFDGDGRFLDLHSITELVSALGKPEDDASNRFTARLLLLLESTVLVEEAVYKSIIKKVVSAYWRDFNDHTNEFKPIFLANDILRLWRTFCVNYEANTKTEPDDKKAKRKYKNYKLKHSRLITCYSALLYLLAIYQINNTVTPKDAKLMVSLSPTERIQYIASELVSGDTARSLENLIQQYEVFLEKSNAPEHELIDAFMNKDKLASFVEDASNFGDLMFESLKSVGGESEFYRLLVV